MADQNRQSPSAAATPPASALALAQIALDAGAAAMRHFKAGCPKTEKPDGSPVTAADAEAEAVILAGLSRLEPGLPVVAEESSAEGAAPQPLTGRFALVDPVDGTRNFLDCQPDFTVNIAVIEHGSPVLGCVYAPAARKLYVGVVGEGAFTAEQAPGETAAQAHWRPIHARAADPDRLIALVSRSHRDGETDAYLDALAIAERRIVGSSLKFCLIAAGEADLYPRLQRVMEWDIAAGHAVLAAAGGAVTTLEGAPVSYGRAEEGFRAPRFIAKGA